MQTYVQIFIYEKKMLNEKQRLFVKKIIFLIAASCLLPAIW